MLANLSQTDQDSLEKNPEDPEASLFSILGSVEKFRNEEGKFTSDIKPGYGGDHRGIPGAPAEFQRGWRWP